MKWWVAIYVDYGKYLYWVHIHVQTPLRTLGWFPANANAGQGSERQCCTNFVVFCEQNLLSKWLVLICCLLWMQGLVNVDLPYTFSPHSQQANGVTRRRPISDWYWCAERRRSLWATSSRIRVDTLDRFGIDSSICACESVQGIASCLKRKCCRCGDWK